MNCGGRGTSWPTILALVFGGIAALIAARSLAIQTVEHRRVTAELAKRADFALTISAVEPECSGVGPDSASLSMPASMALVLFEIGITNCAARAANHTVLNVVVPRESVITSIPVGRPQLQWMAPAGSNPERPAHALMTRELFRDEEVFQRGGSPTRLSASL